MSDDTFLPTGNEVADVQFGEVRDASIENNLTGIENQQRNLEMLYDVPLQVTARLGDTQISIKELLTLGPGAVIELERMAGDSIDLLINGVKVGKGDVVVVNENFGLRITSIINPDERIKNL